ncbi:MAG: PAS domain S-box protein [Herminiimonas sp.]|nr:PAS domain S-box protein [Herminiimonas sp.]
MGSGHRCGCGTFGRPDSSDLAIYNMNRLQRNIMDNRTDEIVTEPNDFISAVSNFPADNVNAWLAALIQSALDGVVVVDATRKIVLLNNEAERMFCYPTAHLLHQKLEILLPARLREEHRLQMNRLAATRMTGRRLRIRLDLRGLRSNGEEFLIDASISRVTVRSEMFLVVIMRELIEKIRFGPNLGINESDLRKLAVSSQNTHEVEKRRFSRELYDDLGQRLSVLKLDLDWLQGFVMPDHDQQIPQRIAQMQAMLNTVIAQTKNIASTLRPPLLDDFGLIPALQWARADFQRKTSIPCKVESNNMTLKVSDAVESAIFRVVQESLLNIERHAHANSVKIVLWHSGHQLDVLIEDDGVGLLGGSQNKPGCYGLVSMQERIYILGGSIKIENLEPNGMVIHVSVPV